jgi:F-type H+-transporting ATPase subunit b
MDTLFDFSSFIIQAINFAIVAIVLRSFIFKPYMKYLEEETAKRAELESKLAESDSVLTGAKSEAEKIVDKARVDAKMMGAEIVENARKEWSEISARAQADADAARAKGFAQVEQERKAMAEELKGKVLDVALKLNQKLFDKNDANVDFLKKNATNIEF